jgi:hypothetical protein
MRMRPPRPRALLPMVLDAAAKLSRTLGATVGDTAGRLTEAARRTTTSTGSSRDTTAAPALAATGPHSIFR